MGRHLRPAGLFETLWQKPHLACVGTELGCCPTTKLGLAQCGGRGLLVKGTTQCLKHLQFGLPVFDQARCDHQRWFTVAGGQEHEVV